MNKFEKVYLDIEQKIKSGLYPIGTRIPTEHELALQYDVSRETVRKAQKLLMENGFIQKRQGQGSTVLDFTRFSLPVTGLVSYKELQSEQKIDSKTTVIVNEIVPAPDFLVGLEDVQEGEPFIHLMRTRSIQGEVMIVDEDYIRCSVVSELSNETASNSIYEYLEDVLNLTIGYANKEFIAEKATETECRLMKLSLMDYVINVKSHVYLEDTTFFQYSVAHHRLEKFRFQEFARRRPRIK